MGLDKHFDVLHAAVFNCDHVPSASIRYRPL